MTRPYPEFDGTRLWYALKAALRELESTGELRLSTAADYVIGYVCQELVARDLVTATGLASPVGRPGTDSGSEDGTRERARAADEE